MRFAATSMDLLRNPVSLVEEELRRRATALGCVWPEQFPCGFSTWSMYLMADMCVNIQNNTNAVATTTAGANALVCR